MGRECDLVVTLWVSFLLCLCSILHVPHYACPPSGLSVLFAYGDLQPPQDAYHFPLELMDCTCIGEHDLQLFFCHAVGRYKGGKDMEPASFVWIELMLRTFIYMGSHELPTIEDFETYITFKSASNNKAGIYTIQIADGATIESRSQARFASTWFS
eukprot:Em0017g255a